MTKGAELGPFKSTERTQESELRPKIPDWVPGLIYAEIWSRREFFLKWSDDPNSSGHAKLVVATINRIAVDDRMKKVWARVCSELHTEEQIRCFADCLWCACYNYEERHALRKPSVVLAMEIAQTAKHLAVLLRRASKELVPVPLELLSIDAALEHATSPNVLWKGFSEAILQRATGPEGHVIRKAWETAPDLAALIEVVRDAAERYEFRETGALGAAVNTRQLVTVKAYLRSLIFLLMDNGIPISDPLIGAIATAATVAIGGDDVDVTAADVRLTIRAAS